MLKELTVSFSKDLQLHKWDLDTDEPKGRYLYLGHPSDTKITYSVNVNGGLLILGTNASRSLTTLELSVPRAYWKHSYQKLLPPQPTIQGTLELPDLNARTIQFDEITPVVYSDEPLSFVCIMIDGGDMPSPFLWARICDRCCVNISGSHLIGFWIDVANSALNQSAPHAGS